MRFYHILRIGEIRGNGALLAALEERWRTKTHTFALSVGKIMVTLEDMTHIYVLSIDGECMTDWTDSSHDILVIHNLTIFNSKLMISSSKDNKVVLGSSY
ncbi:hypothetical protein S245_004306 [Arachis hypogaea]